MLTRYVSNVGQIKGALTYNLKIKLIEANLNENLIERGVQLFNNTLNAT